MGRRQGTLVDIVATNNKLVVHATALIVTLTRS